MRQLQRTRTRSTRRPPEEVAQPLAVTASTGTCAHEAALLLEQIAIVLDECEPDDA